MLAVSVIIPTRDRPTWLEQTIASITRGTLRPDMYEVIVADNGVKTGAAEVVSRCQCPLPRLRYVRVEKPGLHEARHAGMAAATSDLLVYCDDDIIAGKRWLESIWASFVDPAVWLVGGNDLPRFEAPPPAWLEVLWRQRHKVGHYIDVLSLVDFGPGERDIPAGYVFGCNFSIRRRVLMDAGGFHPDGLPAELLRFRGDGETHVSEFVRLRGARARFVPGVTVEHLVTRERMTVGYFERRYFAQGVSDSYALVRAHRGVDAARSRAALVRTFSKWLPRFVRAPALAPRHFAWWRAYRGGFHFHQREVTRDSNLLAWVVKDTYL